MDSLKEIMDIESKGEASLREAQEEAKQIIADANERASQRKEETERQEIIRKAEEKLPEAVDFVIDKLSEVR